MTTMHKKQSGDKTYRKHFFFRLPVQKLCSSCLFSGKALDDLLIKVRDVSDEFLLHGEHSQSIKTILCHGVSQESLDPFQKQKSTSWIQLLSGVWWGESWENWMCMWKCSVGCSWWKKTLIPGTAALCFESSSSCWMQKKRSMACFKIASHAYQKYMTRLNMH